MPNEERQKELTEGAEHLKNNDPLLRPIISRFGICTILPHTNYYEQLVSSIIGQQLSVKAAAKIKGRFVDLFHGTFPSPKEIIDIDDTELRASGFSNAKVRYVKDLAGHIINGDLNIPELAALPNEVIIAKLTAVKGIGEWTAQMFLIFSLGRLDILATGDLGVRTAIKNLYTLDVLPLPSEVTDLARKNEWHPYESLACWYLWRSLDNEPDE